MRRGLRLFILSLALALPGIGHAQSAPPCRTTAGEEGLLFDGMEALIVAPGDFATARSDQPAVQILGPRDGLGVLAVGNTQDAGSVTAQITFAASDGSVVHQCSVRTVAFDAAQHSLAQLQSGGCDLRLVAGLPELRPGHAQVWEAPRPLSEVGIGPQAVADMSTMSDLKLYVLGKRPGMTVLAWLSDGAGEAPSIHLCAMPVIDPAGAGADLADEVLCKDEAGAPMRLAVGQVARMVFPDASGAPTKFGEASVANPSVADFQFEMGAKAGTVTGFKAGSTSLTLLTLHAEVARNCEIVVE